MLCKPTIATSFLGLFARVLATLLIGAGFSLAIAIWAANSRPRPFQWTQSSRTVAPPRPWENYIQRSRYSTHVSVFRLAYPTVEIEPPHSAYFPGSDWSDVAARLLAADPKRNSFDINSAGWPLNCLAWLGSYASVRPGQGPPPTDPKLGIMRVKLPGSLTPTLVPTIPLWRNLAANSAVFGAPFLFLFAVVPFARAVRRRRKGLCPACAYDLKHNLPAGCPECGWNRS